MYTSERDLVMEFLELLRSGRTPWGPVEVTVEFDYVAGRADIVVLTERGEVVAFEAKLRDWRGALLQAYRNRRFAERTYVIMPRPEVSRAMRFEGEFAARDVGLCGVAADGIESILEPQPGEPWLAWLNERARLACAWGT